MSIHPRHPYAGELVFTAFSGSHQDAIKKGMSLHKSDSNWDIPYLTIDPEDIGKQYQAIIRINSQSGKGGVAYILEHDHQCIIPKSMQPDIASFIQKETESSGKEISSKEIWEIFNHEFINRSDYLTLLKIQTELDETGHVTANLNIHYNDTNHILSAIGNGPIDASKKALEELFPSIKINFYSEHSLSQGSDSQAICYLNILFDGKPCNGIGIDSNITLASVKALISAINRVIES